MADQKRRNPAAKQPITSHPLFPAVVILWFGALFGLASVAIRPELIESIVLATGIDRVIPMARPPLGTTTRILLALMATGFGCVLGAVVARMFAKPQAIAITRRRNPATTGDVAEIDEPSPVALFGRTRRIEARDEDAPVEPVAEEETMAEPRIAQRRRQLAMPETPTEDFEDHAPLPGDSPILKVADLGLASFDQELEPDPWVRRSEKRDATAATRPAESADIETPTSAPRPSLFETYVRKEKPAGPGFETVPAVEETSAAEIEPIRTIAEPLAPAEPAPSEPALEPAPAALKPQAAAPFVFDAGHATGAGRILSAPLEDLSHLELLERLALAIERRRAAPVETPAPSPVEVAVQTYADIPAALRPLPMDLGADDDALTGPVPPRRFTLSARTDASAPDPASLDAGYSSLLSVSKQNGAAAAKPVLAFPGTPDASATAPRAFDAPQRLAHSTDQTEQALRAALATLQRISGAA